MLTSKDQNPSGEFTIRVPAFLRKWAQFIPKSLPRACLLLLSVGFGVGFGIQASMLAIKWYETGPIASRDLGRMDFGAFGLQGRLKVKWEEQAEYELRIEPVKKERLAAFASLVNDPPQPLSFRVELRDAEGFILCERNVALRFDFKKGLTPPDDSIPYETRLRALFQYSEAKTAAIEAEEKWTTDNDVFHRNFADDGTLAAISAQGQVPCSRSAFRRASTWAVSTNFPTISEQDALVKARDETSPTGQGPAVSGEAKRKGQAAKSMKGKSAPVPREGYDNVSGYSVIESKIETSGGLTFYVYKDGERDNAIKWGVESAEIHYQCDASSFCTLTRSDTRVVLHVRLE